MKKNLDFKVAGDLFIEMKDDTITWKKCRSLLPIGVA